MAQYVPFSPNIKVNGQTILSFINAMPAYKNVMQGILDNHGLSELAPNEWYSQTAWLEAFREIGVKLGSNTLFAIGKAIPENAIFPPDVQDLEGALAAIDVAYHMNHTEGEIGYYKLLEYNSNLRIAIMECKNPYPSDFDRGIITAMARKFKSPDVIIVKVELDANKPTRLNGADSCHYIVSW